MITKMWEFVVSYKKEHEALLIYKETVLLLSQLF